MTALLRKIAEHTVPLVVVVLLMAGSAVAGGAAGGLIKGSQIKDGSVTGKDIRDHSLTAKDVKGVAGPTGATGAIGPQGARGAGAVLETSRPQQSSGETTVAVKEVIVECPNGPVLSGGHVVTWEEGAVDPRILRSYAVDENSWLVRASNFGDVTKKWNLTVVATCAT